MADDDSILDTWENQPVEHDSVTNFIRFTSSSSRSQEYLRRAGGDVNIAVNHFLASRDHIPDSSHNHITHSNSHNRHHRSSATATTTYPTPSSTATSATSVALSTTLASQSHNFAKPPQPSIANGDHAEWEINAPQTSSTAAAAPPVFSQSLAIAPSAPVVTSTLPADDNNDTAATASSTTTLSDFERHAQQIESQVNDLEECFQQLSQCTPEARRSHIEAARVKLSNLEVLHQHMRDSAGMHFSHSQLEITQKLNSVLMRQFSQFLCQCHGGQATSLAAVPVVPALPVADLASERAAQPVVIRVVNNDGTEDCYKIKRHTQFKKLLGEYREKHGSQYIRFTFKGSTINEEQTPNDLKMEDGAIVDAVVLAGTSATATESKITFTLARIDGSFRRFRMNRCSRFTRMFDAYLEKHGPHQRSAVHLTYKGSAIDKEQTPNDLNMADGDSIVLIVVSDPNAKNANPVTSATIPSTISSRVQRSHSSTAVATATASSSARTLPTAGTTPLYVEQLRGPAPDAPTSRRGNRSNDADDTVTSSAAAVPAPPGVNEQKIEITTEQLDQYGRRMDLDDFCRDVVPDFAPLGGNRPDCATVMAAAVSLLEDSGQQSSQSLFLPPDVLDTAMAAVCATIIISFREGRRRRHIVPPPPGSDRGSRLSVRLEVVPEASSDVFCVPYNPYGYEGCWENTMPWRYYDDVTLTMVLPDSITSCGTDSSGTECARA